jgi:hypothetical protein
MICRLDYTDETHSNSISGFLLRAVPYVVTRPHYHSSPLNRRFFRGITAPQTLHDAVPYNEPGRTFDAILRWFCADTNIESLPPGPSDFASGPGLPCMSYQPDLANLIGRSLDSIASKSEAAWRTLLDDLINRGLFSKSIHNLGHNGFLNLVFVRRERAAQERTRRDGTSSDGEYTFG